jgi:uncharacterized protein (DUF2252 family)
MSNSRLIAVALLCTLVLGCDERKEDHSFRPVTATTSAAGAASPFDVLDRTYAPYTSASDPLGFPMKVRNLSTNSYRFWRGSKELFYLWCKSHVADWLADEGAYLRIHGDLHPGNMGTYAAAGAFGRRFGFGAVDFDDSARLPFQIELLEGIVTFRLLAKHNDIKLDDDKADDLVTELLEAYRAALVSDKTAAELLEGDRWVARLFKEARKRDYAEEVEKYVHDDRFVAKRGNEVLQPETDRQGVARAIREGVARAPELARLLEDETILEVARRTQLESAGSEGLAKYLVLISTKNVPGERVILYLKQEIPSSAERAGVIAKDTRPPGQRCAQDMERLCKPPADYVAWCDYRGGSYRLTVKEPWTETLPAPDGYKDLLHLAKIWGTVAGTVHRQGPQVVRGVTERLTPQLKGKLRDLGAAYAAQGVEEFHAFTRDPRARARIAQADAALKELK